MLFPWAVVALPAELPAGAFDGPAVAGCRTIQQPGVPLQGPPMFPQGCSRRKPELPYQQHSKSAGPCRQLSSWQWALSERLSYLSELLPFELANTDLKDETALALCRHPRSLRDIHYSLENQKCSSLGRRLHRLPNFQLVLSMVRLLQMVPLRVAQVRTNQQPEVSLQKRPMFPRGCSRRKPELSYQQHSPSAGPCRQLSSGQWALSERLSIELADIDWKCESALAQSRRLRLSMASTAAVENRKCPSPERWLRCLPNYQRALSMVRMSQLAPL